jgi:hypothetical protein
MIYLLLQAGGGICATGGAAAFVFFWEAGTATAFVFLEGSPPMHSKYTVLL